MKKGYELFHLYEQLLPIEKFKWDVFPCYYIAYNKNAPNAGHALVEKIETIQLVACHSLDQVLNACDYTS